MKRRILIYNWIPFDDSSQKGGGVSVYVKNLINALIKTQKWDVYFLSSGRAYDINQYRVFIEPTQNSYSPYCKSFQVVNSPVLAAANLSLPYPHISNTDEVLKAVLGDFIFNNRIDVVHFQNLEGLSVKVLELKQRFPSVKFIYSIHNYYLVCPQVMFWRVENEKCERNDDGIACVNCVPKDVHHSKIILNQCINYYASKGETCSGLIGIKNAVEKYYQAYEKEQGKKWDQNREFLIYEFRRFREQNVEYANKFFDHMLAVSKRTSDIMVEHGIQPDKINVCYIGTEIAGMQRGNQSCMFDGGFFHICYMGYMRKMKGFFFFLDALEQMAEPLSMKMEVTIAALIEDEAVLARIEKLREKFHKIMVYQGYTHFDLPNMLGNVHLGIVPALWEDNLPQVAIEMQAHGVPVLCSDCGGAKELHNNDAFVFKANDVNDMISKLSKIIENPALFADYWRNAMTLVTMEAHIRELQNYY